MSRLISILVAVVIVIVVVLVCVLFRKDIKRYTSSVWAFLVNTKNKVAEKIEKDPMVNSIKDEIAYIRNKEQNHCVSNFEKELTDVAKAFYPNNTL